MTHDPLSDDAPTFDTAGMQRHQITTHQQLVEEWKAELKRLLPFHGPECACTLCHWVPHIMEHLEQAMLASAKGVAEAAKMQPKDWSPMPHNELRIQGFNAAVSQSEHQLDEYFKEAV